MEDEVDVDGMFRAAAAEDVARLTVILDGCFFFC